MADSDISEPSQGFLRRLVMLERGEGPAVAWAFAYSFFVVLSFYLLRPIREAFGIARGADSLPLLMTGTLAVMLLANPAFAALVSRLPRRRFIPLAHRFFALNLMAFFALFRWLPAHATGLGYAFFIWLSVFNLFVVSLFWGFMSDLFREEQGKRLFSFLAIGGTLGAIAGAALTGALVGGFRLGGHTMSVAPAFILLLSAAALEAAARCMGALAVRFRLGDTAGAAREPGPGALEGLKALAKSPYLQMICGYMLLYTLTSTLLYLAQGAIVARTFTGSARTVAFARIDFWVNVLTLASQLFLTSRLLTRFGVGVILCALPVLTALGFGALALWPVFGTLMAFQVLRRGLHYGVDRPAREVLYIPLSADERYKSKPFIDTFVYRFGDLLGAWLPALLAAVAIPVFAASLGASLGWLGAGLGLRRLRKRMGFS
ncbi:MAG: MFS transporter [Acidobacteria bacterium]|nr:MFS transporter [Acidobacteriota bacterium]